MPPLRLELDPKVQKTAPWLFKARMTDDYPGFKRAVDAILQDDTVADADLEKRAMRHLETLGQPDMLQYNKPAKHIVSLLNKDYNMKRVLEAIYGTAHDLGLKDGGRYVLAAICACATLVDEEVDGLGDTVSRSERLAIELTCLADLWYRYVLDEIDSPGYRKAHGLAGGAEPTSELGVDTRQQVRQRDRHSCFKTGGLDGGPMERSRLVVVPIWERPYPSDRGDGQGMDAMKADFFKHLLGIERIEVALDSPANALLLDRSARDTWCMHRWTLKPTQIPNRYKIVDMNERRRNGGGERNGVYITFVDHSADQNPTAKSSGVELPSRDLILVHAACTSIMHRSGGTSLTNFWSEDGWNPVDGYLGPPDEDATRLAEGTIWSLDDLLAKDMRHRYIGTVLFVLFMLWWG